LRGGEGRQQRICKAEHAHRDYVKDETSFSTVALSEGTGHHTPPQRRIVKFLVEFSEPIFLKPGILRASLAEVCRYCRKLHGLLRRCAELSQNARKGELALVLE
jgi:hypothetical protein